MSQHFRTNKTELFLDEIALGFFVFMFTSSALTSSIWTGNSRLFALGIAGVIFGSMIYELFVVSSYGLIIDTDSIREVGWRSQHRTIEFSQVKAVRVKTTTYTEDVRAYLDDRSSSPVLSLLREPILMLVTIFTTFRFFPRDRIVLAGDFNFASDLPTHPIDSRFYVALHEASSGIRIDHAAID